MVICLGWLIVSSSVLQDPEPGAFILAGGGTTTKPMIEKFAQCIGGKDQPVLVLAQTREKPENGKSSVELLEENGFTKVSLIADEKCSEERLKELEVTFEKSKGFWVPGGNQELVIERFGQQWFHNQVSKAIQRGASWFGTSAGAMVVSDPMISGNLPNGDPKIIPGAGLCDLLIDTHYRTRNRESRMRFAFFRGKYSMAVGLNEGEWIVVKKDLIYEKHGEPAILLKELLANVNR